MGFERDFLSKCENQYYWNFASLLPALHDGSFYQGTVYGQSRGQGCLRGFATLLCGMFATPARASAPSPGCASATSAIRASIALSASGKKAARCARSRSVTIWTFGYGNIWTPPGIAGQDDKTPLFRAADGKRRKLTKAGYAAHSMHQMLKRRLVSAGLPHLFSPH